MADAPKLVIRDGCETTAAGLAFELAVMHPPLGQPWAVGCRATTILFDSTREHDLTALLAEPAVAVIDVSCDDPIGGLARFPSALLLRVSTAMALRQDISGPLTAALGRRLPSAALDQTGLRAALQEAIGNAVIHGNLGLDGRLRTLCDGLEAFAHMMESRGQDPHFNRRPVTIAAKWNAQALVVTVEDRGAGFDPDSRLACCPDATAASGRGLAEIRHACSRVSFLDAGRRISMRFKLAPHSISRQS